MKRYSLLTLLLLTITLSASAAVTFTDKSNYPNLVFTVLDEDAKTVSVKAESISYYGPDSILNIPASVTNSGNTYTITTIAADGFKAINIKQIILPSTIKTIEYQALRNITTPFTLELNEGLEIIGERAFTRSTGLSSLTIPSTVVEIGSAAFFDCSSVKKVVLLPTQAPTLTIKPSDVGRYYNFPLGISINIPNKTYFIYASAENWDSWELIDPYVHIQDNLRFTFASLTEARLLGFNQAPQKENPATLVIPNTISVTDSKGIEHSLSVTQMAKYCFMGTYIKSIDVPSSISTIADSALRSISTLTSITLHEGLKVIGERAFTGNSGLTTITIPASVEEIGSASFFNCGNLTSVTMLSEIAPKLNILPKDKDKYYIFPLTSIINIPERSYFNYATNEDWATFRLKDSYTHIEKDLRFSISSLTEVTVDSFATKPINSPYNLVIPERVTIYDLNDTPHEMEVTTIGARAFRDNQIITSITFNSNLKVIGERSFTNDKNFSSLEIPASVTEIGAAAFYGCKNGLKVKMLPIVPPITTISNEFDSIFGDKPIIEIEVPCGYLNEYSKAFYWKDISNKLVTRCKPQLKMSIGDALTEETVVSSIAFSRTFPMNLWQELYLPFEVDSVLVLDGDEYYNINVPFDSTKNAGYFYLYGLKNVDMEAGSITFQEVHKLEGFTPYLILFIDKYTDYFAGKEVVFKTKLGEYTLTDNYSAPTLTPAYQLHGNKSLWEHSLTDGFTLSSSYEDGQYKFHFDYNESAPIHPFSWVVTPTEEIASKIMPAPRFLAGRWGNQSSSGSGDVTTSIENTSNNSLAYTQSGSLLTLNTQGQPCKVYAVDGTLLLSTNGAQDEVTIELSKGLYIIYSNGQSQKVLF